MVDLAQLTGPLDRMTRNVRVLARRAAVSLWHGDRVPERYLDFLGLVAAEMRSCADELTVGRLPLTTRTRTDRVYVSM